MAFPTSPTLGQVHVEENSVFKFTNDGWQRAVVNIEGNLTDYRMGEYLDELLDVDLDGVQDGDVIRFDGTKGIWVAAEFTGGSGGTGTNGLDGLGWTGAGYDASTGVVTFLSSDGLGFVTGDLRGATGPQGPQGIQGPAGADSVVAGPQGPEGPEGPQGDTGAPGTNGTNGTNGNDGVSPVLSIGTVTSLAAGLTPTVTITGTSAAPVLNFELVAGDDGADGSGGGSLHYGSKSVASNFSLVQNTYNTVPLGTTETNSGLTSITNGFEIVNAGDYVLSYTLFSRETSGSNRCNIQARLLKNGTKISGSQSAGYMRNSVQEDSNVSAIVMVSLAAGDEITIEVQKDSSVTSQIEEGFLNIQQVG